MRDKDGFIEVYFPITEAGVASHRESAISEEEDSGMS